MRSKRGTACVVALLLVGLVAAFQAAFPAAAQDAESGLALSQDGAALSGGKLHLKVTVPEGAAPVTISTDDRPLGSFELAAGEHDLVVPDARLGAGRHAVTARSGNDTATLDVRVIPGWLSVVPPLVAIGLALVFKDVLLSLFLGVFTGALILHEWNPIAAFARSLDAYVLPSLADPSQAKIVVFTTLLGGMVGVITRSGGTLGIVERLTPYATTSRRGQLAAWVLGVAIFFDDYANTLIVGSTMRPITDRLKISREKLAYIVDSTAAPVVSIMPISTWIGFEIGLMAAAFTELGLDFNAFEVFVQTIPYRFYPLLALVLGFTVAASGRDLGPMLAAERRAAETGELMRAGDTPLADYRSEALEPPEGTPYRAINAVLPILTVVVVTIAGLWATGTAAIAGQDFTGGERFRE
ncbi:MAG TPA: Na+/H+ antiporter NhaC family protein, partial [Thermoanaerobaculia bacterium]|nr:Na+/H+ antiporter NhaC family protein [Thermoanaerobaculia bacterium]